MYRDFEACLRASKSRDPRFDGRFFVGVRTTRIYCRPICPAPSPKPENIAFYPTAAAAEADGLRPCRRCRPETAPGTPEWLGGSAVVARALRLIGDGFLDRRRVDDLACELCIGGRQLRRLFLRHLGAPPSAIAQTRRVQVARMLIDQTDLRMLDVSLDSGFTSLRRFNATIREAFGATPTELRRAARRRRPANGLVLRLPYRPPIAFDEMLAFLAARAVPGIEEVGATSYRRTVRTGAGPGVIALEAAPKGSCLLLHLELPSLDGITGVVERARRIFDLDADPLAIATVLERDPLLSRLVAQNPGLRVPGAYDPFEVGVRGVLGQQISVRAATTLAGRLVRSFGEPLAERAGNLTHVFPTPEVLATASVESIGVPRARAESIRALARAARAGLDLGPTASFAELRERLLTLPGVGPWTAEYIAMRAARDPDAFPASDLGVRHALAENGHRAGAAEAARRSAAWRPWRAYAALHLWSSLSEPAEVAA